ncbi:hypothetical protein [Streptomyces coelicoflavus]|uniref:hypothetical protein n=1 Tax=Streptomyces coelicoflavus TaxID=285562 RepID=UPI0036BE409D
MTAVPETVNRLGDEQCALGGVHPAGAQHQHPVGGDAAKAYHFLPGRRVGTASLAVDVAPQMGHPFRADHRTDLQARARRGGQHAIAQTQRPVTAAPEGSLDRTGTRQPGLT